MSSAALNHFTVSFKSDWRILDLWILKFRFSCSSSSSSPSKKIMSISTLPNTVAEEEEEITGKNDFRSDRDEIGNWRFGGVSEIEEEDSGDGGVPAMDTIEEDLFEGSLFSFDITGGEDCVYVAVGKSESSMDAVRWTLKNLINGESTMVYLIHVFPEIHHIPSPLGKLPKNQVNPEQVETYMAQERGKRRQLLQKFLNVCSASKIKVDTVLIESDTLEKAILDLIPILNVKKLVLGTSKSTLRRMKGKKGSGIGEIVEKASEFCQVKIICEGKEVTNQISAQPTTPDTSTDNTKPTPLHSDDRLPVDTNFNSLSACMCFKSPRVM